jgi:hypothetical protein
MCRAPSASVCVMLQDLTVVAALRQKGLTVEALLGSRVHGRGGLKRGLLLKGRRPFSDGPPAALVSMLNLPVLAHFSYTF